MREGSWRVIWMSGFKSAEEEDDGKELGMVNVRETEGRAVERSGIRKFM